MPEPQRLGPKMTDGLRAYAEMEAERDQPGYALVDERLMRMGYPRNMAYSIMERLSRRGWLDSGVSLRSGWLTEDGKAAARVALGGHR